MANGINATNVADYLKKRYVPGFVENMSFHDHKFLAMVKKRTDMSGSHWVQFVEHADLTGGSATFATAQTNSQSARMRAVQFALTSVPYYTMATIGGQFIRETSGNEGSFKRGLNGAYDSAFRRATRALGQGLYRAGWGAIGNVSSPGASTTLTLTNKEDAVNFEVGDRIQLSATESANTLRDSAAVGTVNAVNYVAGTLTMAANVTTTWSAAGNGDFIFREGDREDSATPTRRFPAGLLDWLPDSAPASTAFFGVDRSVSSRLGGNRYDGSSQNVDEALIDASVLQARVAGGGADTLMMNPKNFGDLVKILGSKVNYIDVKAGTTGGIGFRALELYSPVGTIKVIPDRDCPINRAFLLDMSTWWLGSLGPAPDFLDADGLKLLRQSSDDGYETRIGYYVQLGCTAPGYNMNIKLA